MRVVVMAMLILGASTLAAAQTTNQAPVLEDPRDRHVFALRPLSFELVASDPDGDALSYASPDLPAGASLDGATFTWSPTNAQVGTHTVTFVVSDGWANATQDAVITVYVNRPPTLFVSGPEVLEPGQGAWFETTYSRDPEGGPLSFTWDFDDRDGIGVDRTGDRAYWSWPTRGERVITVTATDQDGLSTTRKAYVAIDDAINARVWIDSPWNEWNTRPWETIEVRVTVTDDLGQAVAGADVAATVRHQSSIYNRVVGSTYAGTTDSYGRFMFDVQGDVWNGRYYVTATATNPSAPYSAIGGDETSTHTRTYYRVAYDNDEEDIVKSVLSPVCGYSYWSSTWTYISDCIDDVQREATDRAWDTVDAASRWADERIDFLSATAIQTIDAAESEAWRLAGEAEELAWAAHDAALAAADEATEEAERRRAEAEAAADEATGEAERAIGEAQATLDQAIEDAQATIDEALGSTPDPCRRFTPGTPDPEDCRRVVQDLIDRYCPDGLTACIPDACADTLCGYEVCPDGLDACLPACSDQVCGIEVCADSLECLPDPCVKYSHLCDADPCGVMTWRATVVMPCGLVGDPCDGLRLIRFGPAFAISCDWELRLVDVAQ